jgi:uncharacterized protein YjdB
VIGGVPQVCVDQTTTLTNPIGGGIWSSSNTARATVDPSTGVVTGVSAGSVVITYMVGTGCFNVLHVTVNPLPASITGLSKVCEGSNITLADATTGGIWISTHTDIATIGFTSGVLTGVSGTAGTPAGIDVITYAIAATGCVATKTVTVNVTPPAIVGTNYICQGSTVTYTDAMAGGTWISSIPSVATIGSLTGVAVPVSLGTTVISYTLLSTGCTAIKQVTVSPLPVIYNITGGGSYCSGGNGVHVGLDGSQIGVSYVLYRGSSATGYKTGTGLPIDFGFETLAGSYSVQATYALSGCTRDMAGTEVVVIIPLAAPVVHVHTGSGSDSSCPGMTVVLSPDSLYGGTMPTFLWNVNGVNVSTAPTYSYIPANGDVVTIKMTSNGNCISSTVATGTAIMTVLPSAAPSVSVGIDPGDSVCQFSLVTFNAIPMYGGSSPAYAWMVNGSSVGSGPSYSYVPVEGDLVHVQMTSNYLCRTADVATSTDVPMTVDSIIIPHVSITSVPANSVAEGQTVTLYATATNAGLTPTYQWKLNGHPIPGATVDSFTNNTYHDYDSITCVVVSSGACKNIGTFDWVFISVAALGVQQTGTSGSDIRLVPNPNSGSFTIKGSIGTADETLQAEVTDMLGQVVYRNEVQVVKGKVNAQVGLTNNLANGMYMLTLHSENTKMVFHFVIEQ